MHDDIMDRSPLRRGVDTVWKKWDENTAILSGDVMLIDAYKRIAKAPACVLDKVTQSFSKMGAEVCEGQQYDMEFESQDYVTMEQYLQMIGLKTAVLIACSAKIGAIIGGASESQCQALYDYGYQLGLAFQVADDYLDAFGDEKVFGKPIGGDILNCKKSWLTVRALEKIDNKERFLEAFNSQAETPEQKAEKIKKVKDMYIELGIDADAKKEIEMFTEKSLEAAANAGFNEEQIEVLRKFTVKLVGRAK
jgi:geranylgeranyl diphosphate synthase type II